MHVLLVVSIGSEVLYVFVNATSQQVETCVKLL